MSLPHQPPLYGVSSGCPTSEATYGPTSVPWRVITASTHTSTGRMRRITFTSWPAIDFLWRRQSASLFRK